MFDDEIDRIAENLSAKASAKGEVKTNPIRPVQNPVARVDDRAAEGASSKF